MGNKAAKVSNKLAARQNGWPQNGVNHKGHAMHKPGSQNRHKQ